MIFEVLVFLRKTKTSKPFSGRFNTPGFTYGYLCLTPLGLLEIVVEVSTPKGLKIVTDEIGGT